jgi:hypothetical protein
MTNSRDAARAENIETMILYGDERGVLPGQALQFEIGTKRRLSPTLRAKSS